MPQHNTESGSTPEQLSQEEKVRKALEALSFTLNQYYQLAPLFVELITFPNYLQIYTNQYQKVVRSSYLALTAAFRDSENFVEIYQGFTENREILSSVLSEIQENATDIELDELISSGTIDEKIATTIRHLRTNIPDKISHSVNPDQQISQAHNDHRFTHPEFSEAFLVAVHDFNAIAFALASAAQGFAKIKEVKTGVTSPGAILELQYTEAVNALSDNLTYLLVYIDNIWERLFFGFAEYRIQANDVASQCLVELEKFSAWCERKSISFNFGVGSFDSSLPIVTSTRLISTWMKNVLSNALKAHRASQKSDIFYIDLSLEIIEHNAHYTLVVRVSDNGMGINKSPFRFESGKGGYDGQQPSTATGMYALWQSVQRKKGDTYLESNTYGGTTAVLELPLSID